MYETWKAIPGYEGSYEASDQGRVRGLDRTGHNGQQIEGRMMTPNKHMRGYTQIKLTNGCETPHLIHRLVAAAFLGPCPEGLEVNHKNGVKTDNRLDNLEYTTPSENTRLAFVNGDFRRKFRGQHSRGKLTGNEVREIRGLLAEGVPQRRIAEMYGVTRAPISKILHRKTWANVE